MAKEQMEMHWHRLDQVLEEIRMRTMWAKHIAPHNPTSAGASLECARQATETLREEIDQLIEDLAPEFDRGRLVAAMEQKAAE